MKNGFGAVVLLAACVASQTAMAADLAAAKFHQCMARSESTMPDLGQDDLSVALRTYFDAGRDGMKDERLAGSRTPAFTWAYKTRLACSEALGYLDGGHVDRVSVQQCDCFYQRYVSFR